jgi:hypothetical protein
MTSKLTTVILVIVFIVVIFWIVRNQWGKKATNSLMRKTGKTYAEFYILAGYYIIVVVKGKNRKFVRRLMQHGCSYTSQLPTAQRFPLKDYALEELKYRVWESLELLSNYKGDLVVRKITQEESTVNVHRHEALTSSPQNVTGWWAFDGNRNGHIKSLSSEITRNSEEAFVFTGTYEAFVDLLKNVCGYTSVIKE